MGGNSGGEKPRAKIILAIHRIPRVHLIETPSQDRPAIEKREWPPGIPVCSQSAGYIRGERRIRAPAAIQSSPAMRASLAARLQSPFWRSSSKYGIR